MYFRLFIVPEVVRILQQPSVHIVSFLIYSMSNNGMPLKSGLMVMQGQEMTPFDRSCTTSYQSIVAVVSFLRHLMLNNLCTTGTLLKPTDPLLSFLLFIVWVRKNLYSIRWWFFFLRSLVTSKLVPVISSKSIPACMGQTDGNTTHAYVAL